MSKKIKLKDLLKENFSGTMMGGMVSRSPFHTNKSLSKIVKEKYGDVDGEQVNVKGLTTEISSYNKIGEAIFGKSNITQIAEKLSWIANQARSHTLQETEDWFDRITVNRNMKELTGLSGQFGRIANDAKSLQERMGALYEDMGNILGRYYEISETVKEETGDKDEYQKFFRAALKKFGVSEPDKLPDEKKKEFYDYVDANWEGDNESDQRFEFIYIKVYNNNVEKALSKLKKEVKETKLMLELRDREFYTKPSALKREKNAKARLRMKKNTINSQFFLIHIYLYIYEKYTTAFQPSCSVIKC